MFQKIHPSEVNSKIILWKLSLGCAVVAKKLRALSSLFRIKKENKKKIRKRKRRYLDNNFLISAGDSHVK